MLEEEGFWGKYMLDERTVCYRTLTALRLFALGEEKWRMVLSGERDEEEKQDVKLVGVALREILKTVEEDVGKALKELDEEESAGGEEVVEGAGDEARLTERKIRGVLRDRWLQVGKLAARAIDRK